MRGSVAVGRGLATAVARVPRRAAPIHRRAVRDPWHAGRGFWRAVPTGEA